MHSNPESLQACLKGGEVNAVETPFNPLQLVNILSILKLCIFPTECVSVFCMFLKINSDVFLKQDFNHLISVGDMLCFLCSMNGICVYYVEEKPSIKY
jgi:hypothetical protein